MKALWRRNEKFRGIEILFSAPISETLQSKLEEHGFKWSSAQRFWYAKETAERVAFANQIAVFQELAVSYRPDREEIRVQFSSFQRKHEPLRQMLRDAKYRYHSQGRYWYSKRTEESVAVAKVIREMAYNSAVTPDVLAKAYGNLDTISKLDTSEDQGLRNLSQALKVAAPDYAKLREDIEKEVLYNIDIPKIVINAINKSLEMKTGLLVQNDLQQEEQSLSAAEKELLQLFTENKNDVKKLADNFLTFAHALQSMGNPKDGVFGDQAPTADDIVQASIERVNEYDNNLETAILGKQFRKRVEAETTHERQRRADRSRRSTGNTVEQPSLFELDRDENDRELEAQADPLQRMGSGRVPDGTGTQGTTADGGDSGTNETAVMGGASVAADFIPGSENGTSSLDRSDSVGTRSGNDLSPGSNRIDQTEQSVAEPKQIHGGPTDFSLLSNDARRFIPSWKVEELGGGKTKFKQNVQALELLKQLEYQGREASLEEKETLAKYVGWGGLAPAFDQHNDEWEKEYRELKGLVERGTISSEEYEMARRSTMNAHYTTPAVINFMYETLERMGFKGGAILEPSMGIGNFFGFMPDHIRKASTLTGIELDSLSGRIAKALYPEATIHIQGFQEYRVPNAKFDLVISNVPFGDLSVFDPTYKGEQSFVTKQIHNYFFIKALDQVREGGIVAFVTSTGTLNSPGNEKIRQLIADKANFLGAIRLPNDTFKKYAGTEVTTDILFLQKRRPGEQQNHRGNFIYTVVTDLIGQDSTPMHNNVYFEQNPERVLGELVEDKLYGNRIAVESDGSDLTQRLQAAVQFFPENIYQPRKVAERIVIQQLPEKLPSLQKYDEYNLISYQGVIHQKIKNEWVALDLPTTSVERIQGMIPIRDAANNVLHVQRIGASDEELHAAQMRLNEVYDRYVKHFGYLNEPANIRAFQHDLMGSALLRSIEKNVESKKVDGKTVYFAEKEAIFTDRTIQANRQSEKVETAQEALIVSIFERGKVDWGFMTGLLGKNQVELQSELKGLVFENPQTGVWETADEYLSGNVREKLRIAEEAADQDERFVMNVEALQLVQPEDLTPGQIHVRLGAPWIPASDIESFIHDFLQVNNKVKVGYQQVASQWTIEEKRTGGAPLSFNTKNTEEFGVKNPRGRDVTALQIIEDSLNLRQTKVSYKDDEGKTIVDLERTNEARAKQKQVQAIFQDWIWSDEERSKRLCKLYNERFNSVRLREYDGEAIYGRDGEHKAIPGLNRKYALRPHQKNAVFRIVQGGNTLLAHVVGAGKTLEMIVAGMEMKRLGLINKPMYAVPNHLLDQWEHEFLDAYPGAKILKINNDGIPSVGVRQMKGQTKEEYNRRVEENRANRRAALTKIAVGNYDAVLITHSTFTKLPMSPRTVQEHIREQIADVEYAIESARAESGGGGRTLKNLEKTKMNLETALKINLDEASKDVAIPFEELGIDQLFVDEAHMFKNLKYHTKMSNVAGLSQAASKRAQDMYLKTQWLTKKYNGRGVVFATGTPISNTMAEMYTLQRYMQMDTLRKNGIAHFDAWASIFGEAVSGIEMDSTGRFKQKTRFSRFHNVTELMAMFRSFADIKTADMLSLPVPKNVIRETIVAPMSPEQELYLKELVKRAERIKNGMVRPDEDNYLKLTGDGRKAALDIRMVEPSVSVDFPDSKVNYCVDNVFSIWKETEPDRLTQLIFLDLGTPKKREQKDDEKQSDQWEDIEESGNIQVYDDIKVKLMRKGVRKEEIAFIHDAKTDKQRFELFEKVRAGEVRVLIGSTEKMGAGMNVQTRLIALHHLDAPWRPSDVEQREGRIIRQGNLNDTVRVFTYTTEGSFDALMWDTLRRKATFIAQVMNGKANVRSLEDVEELVLGYAQIAAVTSGNPLILEKHEIDQKVLELQSLQTSFERNKRKYQDEILRIPQEIDNRRQKIAHLQADIGRRLDTAGDHFRLTLQNQVFTDRKEAGEALLQCYLEVRDQLTYGQKAHIGEFAGFDLYVEKGQNDFLLSGNTTMGVEINTSSVSGTLRRLENAPNKLEDELRYQEERIAYLSKRIEDLKELVKKPFDKAEELKASIERQAVILKQLMEVEGDSNSVQDVEEESEINKAMNRRQRMALER